MNNDEFQIKITEIATGLVVEKREKTEQILDEILSKNIEKYEKKAEMISYLSRSSFDFSIELIKRVFALHFKENH